MCRVSMCRVSTLCRTSNGMMVAAADGTRLTTRAIRSAVWSCSSRPASTGEGRGGLGRGEPGGGVGQPPVGAVRQLQRDPGTRLQPLRSELAGPDAVQAEV